MYEQEIFLNALECETKQDLDAYLEEVCGSDDSLRQRIEALLERHSQASQFLERPAVEAVATELVAGNRKKPPVVSGDTLPELETQVLSFLAPSDNPDVLGQLRQYEILEVVGRGGMGIVLRGVDSKLNRVVAIKVLSPEIASIPSAHKRFLREARAAAAVSHDHIVTIYAVEENPIPFLVMEYVDGNSLQQRIDEEGQLEVKEVLRIARQIAAGLAAAHEQGLTHRDIKPSNILLQNGIQRVQITDFGLARAAADADITRTGEIAGTPQYMSPEQAQSKPVDPRSDLFSLGSVIYAMCSGRSPFRAETPYGSIKRVCEDEPRSLRENNPEIPTWLEAIVFKLLAKSPGDRFQTAEDVTELLGKHLSHLQNPGATPFPGTMPEKPAQRKKSHRRMLVATTVVLLTLLTLGFTEVAGVSHVTSTIIRLVTGEGTLVIEVDDPDVEVTIEGDGGLVITGAGPRELRLAPGSYRVQADKYGRPLKEELVTITRGARKVVTVSHEPSRRQASQGSTAAPPAETRVVRRFTSADQPLTRDGVTAVEGGWRIEAKEPRRVRLFELPLSDLEPGRLEFRCQVKTGGRDEGAYLNMICLYPNAPPENRTSAFKVNSFPDWKAFGLSIATPQRETRPELLRIEARFYEPGMLWIRDLEILHTPWPYDRQVVELVDHSRNDLRITPQGTLVVLPDAVGHSRLVHNVTFSPDQRTLVAAAHGGVSGWTSADDGQWRHSFELDAEWTRSLAFSPDGALLAAGGGISKSRSTGFLRVWRKEGATWREEWRAQGGDAMILPVAFSPDGKTIASGDYAHPERLPGKVKLWDASAGAELSTLEPGDPLGVQHVIYSPDDRLLAGCADRKIQIWDVETKGLVATLEHPHVVNEAVFSPDGNRIAACCWDGSLLVWQRDGRLWRVQHQHRTGIQWGSLDFGAGGVVLAIGGRWQSATSLPLRIWDVKRGVEMARLDGHSDRITCVKFAPDGRTLATAGFDGTVKLWDVDATALSGSPSDANTAEPGAFVVLGGEGVAERKFDTLAEAVVNSSAGDTIEIRGNGPFLCDPVLTSHALIIRAGDGFRPVLKFNPDGPPTDAPLLETYAPLVLEGLDLQRWSADRFKYEGVQSAPFIVICWRSALHVANCRLLGGEGVTCVANGGTPIGVIRNCEFINSSDAVYGSIGPDDRRIINNCVMVGTRALAALIGGDTKDAVVHFTNNTVVRNASSLGVFVKVVSGKQRDTPSGPVSFEATTNIFAAGVMFSIREAPSSPERFWPLQTDEAKALPSRLLDWSGRRNLYAPEIKTFHWYGDLVELPFTSSDGLDQWRQLWADRESDVVQGTVRFQGGDVLAKAQSDPQQLTPEDFRLRPDSPGYRAGEDGKDLGADVDLVGPGKAYERWKQTPEYQKWINETKRIISRQQGAEVPPGSKEPDGIPLVAPKPSTND